MNLSKNDVEYTYSSNENSFNEDHSFQSIEHNYINYWEKKYEFLLVLIDIKKEKKNIFMIHQKLSYLNK
jgi:hypothetical protein